MNSTYLSVLFKEVMGESYIKFLTRYRMEYAKELLRVGTRVNDVSERVGYRTYRHFAEVFKKYTGVTPGQYKEDSL
ncbi:HTH-type transcriptional regulator YesS [compost metagenome]